MGLAAVRAAIEGVKRAGERGDAAGLRGACDTLERASHRMAEAIYKSAAPPGTGASARTTNGGGAPARDDVIDAEVVNSDEKGRN